MPNHSLLLRPLQQREALRSSSMEGTYATPEELLLFQVEPKEPQSHSDKVNEWKEVANYGRALATGQQLLDQGFTLSRALIRALHNELMNGVRGQNKQPGQFRKVQVQVGHDARFVPPPPEHVDSCLQDLAEFMSQHDAIDPLIKAFMVHYQFETIHPFTDGNGRVGRLLLSLQIYRSMSLSNPWLYMSAFFERFKDEYVDGLFGVTSRNAWEKWLAFCLRGAKAQADDAMRRFEELVALKEDFRQRAGGEQGGSARLHSIIDSLFDTPVVTVPSLEAQYNVSYPTAKSDAERLVSLGILTRGPKTMRPRPYFSDPILRVAYNEDQSNGSTVQNDSVDDG